MPNHYILRLFVPDIALREKYEQGLSGYEGDAGVDLYVPHSVHFRPWDTIRIDHQVHAEMIDGHTGANVSYYLYPRSSISKTPIRLDNSVGIIDSGYRGPLMASFTALPLQTFFSTNTPSPPPPYSIPAHSRLVQICAPNLGPIRVDLVDSMEELSTSHRGEQGFGSSGR